jgi:hypothetical protein
VRGLRKVRITTPAKVPEFGLGETGLSIGEAWRGLVPRFVSRSTRVAEGSI